MTKCPVSPPEVKKLAITLDSRKKKNTGNNGRQLKKTGNNARQLKIELAITLDN